MILSKNFQDINTLYDFSEGIISNIGFDENGTDFLMAVYYFFDKPNGCKDQDLTLRFKNCSHITFDLQQMIESKKQFAIKKIMPEIERIEINRKNDQISAKICINFKNDHMLLVCDEIWIEK